MLCLKTAAGRGAQGGAGAARAQFGLSGVLADPVLKIYQGSNVIAQNDNWETASAVNSSQVVATRAEIQQASTGTGAFPLTSGSRDAAVIITLAPGNYTAVMSGVNNATGTGLLEAYYIGQCEDIVSRLKRHNIGQCLLPDHMYPGN